MTKQNYLQEFKKRLVNILCEKWDENTLKLIRKHDKHLEKGDFTFPSLSESKIWKDQAKNIELQSLLHQMPEIDKIEERSGIVTVFLNREKVLAQVLNDLRLPQINKRQDCDERRVVDLCFGKPNKSELTSARCASFCSVLANIVSQNVTVCASSTNLGVQIKVNCRVDPQFQLIKM